MCMVILIFSKILNEHVNHLLIVFGVLKHCRLDFNHKKTFLCQEVDEYLDHIISTEGVRMDPSKVSIILSCLAPSNVLELRSYLGISVLTRSVPLDPLKKCVHSVYCFCY